MKRSIIETVFFLALSAPALAAAADPAEAPPAAQTVNASETTTVGGVVEKEYYGTKVLLIDLKAGLLGVLFDNEEEGTSEKLSFRVNPDEVDVTNKLGKFLEFTDITVGATLDLYTITGLEGKETVDQIIAYDVNPAE